MLILDVILTTCMKIRTLIVFLFLTLSALGQNQPDSLGFTNKAEAKNKMVKGKKEGKWVEYINILGHPTKDPKEEYIYELTTYKSGNPIGVNRNYSCEGNILLSEYPYRNGKVNGIVKFYCNESGRLCWEVSFIDGKETGWAKEYYEGGNLRQELSYLNGKKNGMEKTYYESGGLSSEISYINDTIVGLDKSYFKNGNIKYVDSVGESRSKGYAKNETQKEYYENGNLKNETNFSYGNIIGVKKKYYENGVLYIETPYINGERNGTIKMYYKNGKLKSETIYTDNTPGISKSYDETGNEIIGVEKEYYTNDGNLKSETSYA